LKIQLKLKLKVEISTEENKVVKLKFQVVKLNSTFKFDIYEKGNT